MVNGVAQSLSMSLSDALLSMLGEEAQDKQLHHQWRGLWQLSLKLMASLLDSLGHQFISHALDFTGVNHERLIKVTKNVVGGYDVAWEAKNMVLRLLILSSP